MEVVLLIDCMLRLTAAATTTVGAAAHCCWYGVPTNKTDITIMLHTQTHSYNYCTKKHIHLLSLLKYIFFEEGGK